MVEVLHDWEERTVAGRGATRYVRHDVAVHPPIRAWHLQAARFEREGRDEGADGRPRSVSLFSFYVECKADW